MRRESHPPIMKKN